MPFLKPGQRPVPPAYLMPRTTTEATILQRPVDMSMTAQSNYSQQEAERRFLMADGRRAPLATVGGGQLSYLEVASVKSATVEDYRCRLMDLHTWCVRHHRDWRNVLELDSVLVEYFDEQFWKGLPCEAGSKLIAALRFFGPALAVREIVSLQRAARAV